MTPDDIAPHRALLDRIRRQLGAVFIGQEDLVELVLCAMLARGHVLVESIPGLGKTLLVKALGRIWGVATNRIQFTPDLMPSDITGSHIFDMAERTFTFRPGPIFTNLLLADEFNRAPAKTHAALLEVMQEVQVTLDGTRYPLAPPFIVMATQNPIESEGTYNLPEAQLDRFLFKVRLDYPAETEERAILDLYRDGGSPERRLAEGLEPLADAARLLAIQEVVERISVADALLAYIGAVVRRSRGYPGLYLGASPRAGISILQGARALALLRGRPYVVPDDVVDVVPAALRHRLILSPEAEVEGRDTDGIISDILRQVPVPRGLEAEAAAPPEPGSIPPPTATDHGITHP